MAQELLTTFEDAEALQAVTLIPSSTSGRFLVQCYQYAAHDATRSAQDSVSPRTAQLLWDRAIQDGFPEMKVLKQLVRDQIDPSRFLGHSDSTEKVDLLQSTAVDRTTSERSAVACDECAAAAPTDSAANFIPTIQCALPLDNDGSIAENATHVAIAYCIGCRWMLRAAYFAQELLSTFTGDIASVSLVPSRPPSPGGIFQVQLQQYIIASSGNVDSQDQTSDYQSILLWDRTNQGRFPETKELKQLVRDQLNPAKYLGHSDTKEAQAKSPSPALDEMDDEDAEQARAFFGVA
jgi:selT/selW/selH-like putative selenoprotein